MWGLARGGRQANVSPVSVPIPVHPKHPGCHPAVTKLTGDPDEEGLCGGCSLRGCLPTSPFNGKLQRRGSVCVALVLLTTHLRCFLLPSFPHFSKLLSASTANPNPSCPSTQVPAPVLIGHGTASHLVTGTLRFLLLPSSNDSGVPSSR